MSAPAAELDRRGFILEHTRLLPVPHAPEIGLHVAQEATELWQKTEDELATIGLPPPFWAFAWAGGQALARYLLDDTSIVRGRRVLDFASGSGLVAIAAAKAGAAAVEACDIDAFAAEAIAINADANAVRIAVRLDGLVGRDEGWDVVCAGDVCYERAMAERVIAWLEQLAARGAQVLIGDPGRSYLPRARLETLASYAVPVTRSLEDAEIKQSSVWRLKGEGVRLTV
ncbi:nicotinamide N-methyase [Bosea sp. Root381]|uniref:class I SAM-dependent methyltransferase n=1 Tax=Bosea sp. Root381 TaxID=1736524 RepID=UPI0006F22E78|nr:50S ribosomal protein L11 methyltransferase [Bosea sp. Root381]KRE09872.1 nicotinamide N-methyase [Bosea sp. Root381]